jgi:hypothetical protein
MGKQIPLVAYLVLDDDEPHLRSREPRWALRM